MTADHPKPQSSSDNPGWIGPGIPSLSRIIAHGGVRTLHALSNAKFAEAVNYAAAATANAWNFHVRPDRGRVLCPCCGWAGAAFIATANWRAVTFQSRCPNCDSRSRHRGLPPLLATLLASKPPGKLLFFAPERILLEQVIRLVPRSSIVTTDLNSADVDAPFEDIQHLSFTNAAFAMIICNHVLEHVIDDGAAITECARILVPGGICVFTIPGDFDRVPTRPIEPPDGNGHHRHYGMDILERLRGTFCTVEALDMSAASPVQVHVRRFDYAFICRT